MYEYKATGKREHREFTHFAKREWVRVNKANYNDLISDFNLYLCERYGFRNACSVMWNEKWHLHQYSQRKFGYLYPLLGVQRGRG